MAIRYLADNDLRRHIHSAIRRLEPAIDFVSAQAAQLDGLDDQEVLRKAVEQDRILVTHDKRTMPKAMAALRDAGEEAPGVFLVIPQNAAIPKVCESLLLAWLASTPAEWRGRITKIPF